MWMWVSQLTSKVSGRLSAYLQEPPSNSPSYAAQQSRGSRVGPPLTALTTGSEWSSAKARIPLREEEGSRFVSEPSWPLGVSIAAVFFPLKVHITATIMKWWKTVSLWKMTIERRKLLKDEKASHLDNHVSHPWVWRKTFFYLEKSLYKHL